MIFRSTLAAAIASLFALVLVGVAQPQSVMFPGPGISFSTSTPIGTPATLGFVGPSGSVSSIALTASAAIQSADLVVCGIQYDSASQSVSSISDGTNSYAKILRETAGSTATVELWYKANATAVASPTITATLSGAIGTPAMQCGRVSGVQSTPLDQSNGATGSGTTASVATGTLAQANEIAWGYMMGRGTFTETPPGSWTNINHGNSANPQTSALDSITVAATTAVTYNPTMSGSVTWSAIIATFKGF